MASLTRLLDPATALRALAERGHRVVLCEGGPRWHGVAIDTDGPVDQAVDTAQVALGQVGLRHHTKRLAET